VIRLDPDKKVKSMALSSFRRPELTVTAPAVVVTSTRRLVPDVVRLVIAVLVHTVPLPVSKILPVPKFRSLLPEPAVVNKPVDSVRVPKVNAPCVNVKVLTAPKVTLLFNSKGAVYPFA
jgi:hypothetical protein